MRRVIVVAILLAACSGDVRSSSTRLGGASPYNLGSGGAGGSTFCENRTQRTCACGSGKLGSQRCQNSTWSACACDTTVIVTLCQPDTAQDCQCPNGSVGFQICGKDGSWG